MSQIVCVYGGGGGGRLCTLWVPQVVGEGEGGQFVCGVSNCVLLWGGGGGGRLCGGGGLVVYVWRVSDCVWGGGQVVCVNVCV